MSQQAIWGENKQCFQLKISEVDFQKDLDGKIDEELVKTHMLPGFIWEFCLLNHAIKTLLFWPSLCNMVLCSKMNDGSMGHLPLWPVQWYGATDTVLF